MDQDRRDGNRRQPGNGPDLAEIARPGTLQSFDHLVRQSADIAEFKLLAPIVGHVGDGNFHLTLLVDLDDADEVKRAKNLSERLVQRALAMDGTCTGEHGVGQGKMKYLMAEHGAEALSVMTSIKRALDPQNIMNPGKIVALS